MTYAWYPLWTAIASLWVLLDARQRKASASWVIVVAIAGPAGLAGYLAFRPLRAGESREGGRAWQLLSRFSVWWTALLAFAALWNLAMPFSDFAGLAVLWGLPALAAIVVGLALKRASLIEHGPTGLLGAMQRWLPKPETTADGRAYICRECGNQYPVEKPFCEACGAWPGQSG
jgi:hypothetical protein